MTGFSDPLAFLLLPLPLLVAWLSAARVPAPGAALVVPAGIAAGLDGAAGRGGSLAGRIRPLLLPFACWTALVTALAGPQVTLPVLGLSASGREIYLVMDLSGSMRRTDFILDAKPVSRLEAVRRVAAAFIERRAGDRLGLIFFAERTYVAAPASFDLALVRHALTEAGIGVIGTSTAIGDGLGLALKRLKASSAATRLVILLSDGSNTSGRVAPEDAARLAGELGIRVHTIALGTEEKTGGPGAEADAVDVEALQGIAKASGGESFRVRTTEELEAVYRAIERLEASGAAAPPAAVARPLWVYPAALAFALALACVWQGRREA